MSDRWALHVGDCRDVMRAMEPESIDSIVSDPPYGLSFMGKGWDHGVPGVEFWELALRVAKPGCHLLAFGGTRTYHRLACAVEDAGWEVRDCLGWMYGSGFPKSHNLQGDWQGWGTALKPAWEPIILARKPLRGTVAASVLEWGTGAINVDGCRVGTDDKLQGSTVRNDIRGGAFASGHRANPGDIAAYCQNQLGRWPANILHDGSEEITDVLGDASRFFYCAKASKADRDEGCEGLEMVVRACGPEGHTKNSTAKSGELQRLPRTNHHPTVKPTDLMRYLCRLVTPPEGLVFDPFTGSGSTGKAAMLEGFRFVGAELSEEYATIARARIGHAAGRERQMELALA